MSSAQQAVAGDTMGRVHELERELQDFSYIVSHDLMASFRHINGFIGILADDLNGELTSQQLATFERVRNAAGDCHAMLDQMLVYSRAQQRPLDLSVCDADCLVYAARLQLGLMVREAGADFDVEDLGEVRVDQELMTHALMRILDNCLKYRAADTKPQIVVRRVADPSDWVVHVRDNGVGLPSGDPEKLFRMFHRGVSRDGPEGVGAGLAICRRIFRRHGGEVRFAPQETGACLELRLPAVGPSDQGAQP